MAAIGSRVRLDTCKPAVRMAAYRLSTTSPGKNVATTSASARCPVCARRDRRGYLSSRYCATVYPTIKNCRRASSSICKASSAADSAPASRRLMVSAPIDFSSDISMLYVPLWVRSARPAAATHTRVSRTPIRSSSRSVTVRANAATC